MMVAAVNLPDRAFANTEPSLPVADPLPGDPVPQGRSLATTPRIDVIGADPADLEGVPGAAAIVTPAVLEAIAPISASEALRTVPGVHVVEEEGLGLRLNVGLRGLDPNRSRNLLVLEDGIPISLAPYGEPEMYYAPPIERMASIEIVKGSGSILFGPQTVGGVLNYITPEPPKSLSFSADARAGSFGYYQGHATIGNTHGAVGYWISAMHGRFEGHRSLDLSRTDVTAKLRLALSPRSFVGLKLNVYDEMSGSTYLGLTTPQYQNNPSANPAIHDVLPLRRYGLSATHNALLGSDVLLQTTVYGHYITRNWARQDFDRKDGGRSYERIIDGRGMDILGSQTMPDDGSALYFRSTMGSRNRSYTVGGVEPRVTWNYGTGILAGELIGGARFHYEGISEQRLDGRFAGSRTGDLREDETRRGLALAGYLQNRFTLWDRLDITPGIRVESLWGARTLLRKRVTLDDGSSVNQDMDPPIGQSNNVVAVIPGLGLAYRPLDFLTVFAGVHRGFAPPRTKDAITADGEDLQLDSEYSWNYEAGVRVRANRWLSGEVTGFVLDFQNQIIPPTEAGGAVAGVGGQALVNSGRTLHAGLESTGTFDIAELLRVGFNLPLTLSYTYVHARFRSGWADPIQGNRLPYAPEHIVTGRLGFEHPVGLAASVSGHYLSEQFTDKENTRAPSVDGLRGVIGPRFLLDARLAYTYRPWGLGAYLTGKNLLDSRYIASRAPSGIQPGMFRQIIGGIQYRF
jgi:Fe(3+) dicitrate transport protein